MTQVLDRRHRLTRSADFTQATRHGRRAGTRSLVVHTTTEPSVRTAEPEGLRVGFVVGKPVGGAVVRNQVKRRLRHLVRERMRNGAMPTAGLLVVRALPAAAATTYRGLGRDLDTCLARLTGVPGARPAGRRDR